MSFRIIRHALGLMRDQHCDGDLYLRPARPSVLGSCLQIVPSSAGERGQGETGLTSSLSTSVLLTLT